MKLLTFALWWMAFSTAWAEVRLPPVPALATYQLAEAARGRPLTAAEVTEVRTDPISSLVYLEAASQAALLRGQAAAYLPLPAAPGDDCLADTMHALFALARDGMLSDADLDQLYASHYLLSYFAYRLATDGGTSAHLAQRMAEEGLNVEGLEGTQIARYYWIRASEPTSLDGRLDLVIRHTWRLHELGAARLIELGDDARNLLWSRVSVPRSRPADEREAIFYDTLVHETVMVLGAAGDVRLRQLPALYLRETRDLTEDEYARLVTAAAGTRNILFDRPVFFWKAAGCWGDPSRTQYKQRPRPLTPATTSSTGAASDP